MVSGGDKEGKKSFTCSSLLYSIVSLARSQSCAVWTITYYIKLLHAIDWRYYMCMFCMQTSVYNINDEDNSQYSFFFLVENKFISKIDTLMLILNSCFFFSWWILTVVTLPFYDAFKFYNQFLEKSKNLDRFVTRHMKRVYKVFVLCALISPKQIKNFQTWSSRKLENACPFDYRM